MEWLMTLMVFTVQSLATILRGWGTNRSRCVRKATTALVELQCLGSMGKTDCGRDSWSRTMDDIKLAIAAIALPRAA
jgi:hypothetical protein